MRGKLSGLPPVGLLLALSFVCGAAERWKIQFHYDKAESFLNIRDLQCPSVQRCIAAGAIIDKKGRSQGAVVVTSDGGQHWSVVEVRDQPISLFFLNDSVGWMVTDKGLWLTNESGRSWKKLEGSKKGMVRVQFRDPQHGYAIGFPSMLLETTDGAKTWSKIAAGDRPDADAQKTIYDCITFLGDHGVVTGRVMPFQFEEMTPWRNADAEHLRRERRAPTILIETLDGGKKWDSTTSQLYGHITRVMLAHDAYALALFEYDDEFAVPASIYSIRLGKAGSANIFSEKDLAVRDFALLPNGTTYLAAIQTPGRSNQVPIPSKLKMLRTANRKVWEEVDVDYRAVAQRAVMSAADDQHVWVATDTGMILRLLDTPDAKK